MLHRCNEHIGPKLTFKTSRLHQTDPAAGSLSLVASLVWLLTEPSSGPELCPATACPALSKLTFGQALFQQNICPVPMERKMGRKRLAQLSRVAAGS